MDITYINNTTNTSVLVRNAETRTRVIKLPSIHTTINCIVGTVGGCIQELEVVGSEPTELPGERLAMWSPVRL